MKERKCQAAVHEVECPCVGCTNSSCAGCRVPTVDHFQPKSINRTWGTAEDMEDVNRQENLVYLSWPCHKKKDASTQTRLKMLRDMLKRGKAFTLDDYRREILARWGEEIE